MKLRERPDPSSKVSKPRTSDLRSSCAVVLLGGWSRLDEVVWYRLGQVKTNRLVADDGSTDADVGGMDASEDQSPAGCTPVADLPAGGRGGSPITRWPVAGRPRVPPCGCGGHGSTSGPLGSVRGCPAWASAHRLSPRKVRASLEATRHTTPPDAPPLAHAQGVSPASVAQI